MDIQQKDWWKQFLAKVVNNMKERDKNIWIYNSGLSFSGNPKWMFMYMLKSHPEVKGVWLCYERKTLSYIKKLGYEAHLFKSQVGKNYMKKAGVYVVNQMKEVIQPELSGITMLNLWHGVGCKPIEQKLTFGYLRERVAKKHIKNHKFYRDNQLFLVTSPLMENHFVEQCGLDEHQVIKSGYPCCTKMEWVKTFDHNLRERKGLTADSRIAIYCPTYRDKNPNEFFRKAIPDMDRLIHVLEETNTLLIFKLHPHMENDRKYNEYKNRYSSCPYLLFWNNENDVYEIFNQIDLAIVDYSSIFYDMLMAGVKNFVRYMFDIDDEDNLREFVFDVKEMTCGTMCQSFEQLLNALTDSNLQSANNDEVKRLKELFWEYEQNGLEEIYTKTVEHKVADAEECVLCSFDVFDTLIKRKCLSPEGVFAYVRQKMYLSNMKFPIYLIENYVKIRRWCEANVREYYRKTQDIRRSDRLEIEFSEIFYRMKETYDLTQSQVEALMQWELEGEYENCIPVENNIKILKKHLEDGDTVVLISDMYLPKEFVRKLLIKADAGLGELPLFLSSEYGVQKTTKKLYLEVFSSFEKYIFTQWIHYGDNPNADGKQPRELGIKTVNHVIPQWSEYERKIIESNSTYDTYRCAALFRRFKLEMQNKEESIKDRAIFSYCYVSTWLVPYVAWAVDDARSKGIECLYFISRDGYHMKRIADVIIEKKHLNIKTKYIYGSRKVWRIPSYIEQVDIDFFSSHGNLADVKSYEMLIEAMSIDERQFERLFPELVYLKKVKYITRKQIEEVRNILNNSLEYKDYLLAVASKERQIVVDYLKQEIDFNERFAFVEYWGRGYTQDCLARLLDYAMIDAGVEEEKLPENVFYYLRSIYASKGRLKRNNFLNTQQGLIMVEAIFANMPYNSVEAYEEKNGCVVPVISVNQELDTELYQSMEKYLVRFAEDYYAETIIDEKSFNRALCQFGLDYYRNNKADDMFVKVLARLKDSVSVYGKKVEFAPPIGMRDIYLKLRYNEYMHTKSIDLSLIKSNWFCKMVFKMYRKIVEGRRKR